MTTPMTTVGSCAVLNDNSQQPFPVTRVEFSSLVTADDNSDRTQMDTRATPCLHAVNAVLWLDPDPQEPARENAL